MPYKLSSHSLNLFKDCQRCFWLTQHKKWQRPESPFPSLPSGMDSILKLYFDKFARKDDLPLELKKYSEFKDIKLFNDLKKLEEWRNNLKGISWKDENGNELMGAVDNVLVSGEKLIVLDYKTRGFPLRETNNPHYEDQMNIYNFLLRKNGFETENFSYLLYYIPDEVIENGVILFSTFLKKVNSYPEKAEKLFIDAIQLLNGPYPKHVCNWCRNVEE